jgi:ppGpp synthetase/RelA/SpoT-type nucleotidyltranferase
MEHDAKIFEDMARNIDTLIPHLVGEAQKESSRASANHFRARAKELRALLEIARGQDWGQ